MKILLINPSVGYYTRALSNPLGLLSIGTYLKQHGHEVKIYDRCVDKTKIETVIKEFDAQIVGVSVMSSRGLKDAIKVSALLKKKGKTVVWGGQLPSMQTELVLDSDYVDMVSFGEGEETWKELAECLENGRDFYDIRGIAYKKDGKIKYNECRPFADLKDMPVSDWSLLDVPKYMQTYLGCNRMMYIYSSKGCPCRCAFCSNVNFHKS
ncbi:MAG: cobalamin-dependent protein, partial [Clostridia bacterium]|nr:cobalamin-dependent protein [Clostridia bacterium]